MINPKPSNPLLLVGCLLAVPVSGQTVDIGGTTYNVERLGGPEIVGASNDIGDFTQPTFITQAPGDNDNLYIVERSDPGGIGQIIQFDTTTNTKSTYLDINGTLTQDGGLLTMAFHPNFQSNGLLYVAMVEGSQSKVVEYDASNGFSARTLLEYDQPPAGVLHTVNWVGFQPGAGDGQLYVLAGDGGFQANNPNFDPAIIENTDSPYGKLMRFDTSADFTTPVDGLDYVTGTGTALSADARVEVVASGMRNPYRGAFDDTGGLFIGDVGFQAAEEITYLTPAQIASASIEDLGWTAREGTIQTPVAGIGGPKAAGDIDPFFDYLHNGIDPGDVGYTGDTSLRGSSVTSGYLVNDQFFFADFVTGEVYAGAWDGTSLSGVTRVDDDIELELNDGISFITSFGTDNEGNLYIVDFGNAFFASPGTGEVFKLSAVTPPTSFGLSYDAATGELVIDTLGETMTAYLIQGAGFLEENHNQVLSSVITSEDGELAEADPFAGVSGVFSLGAVLPTNLSEAEFLAMVTLGQYTTDLGDPIADFDLSYLRLTGDADGDGDIDDTDLGLAISNFTGPVGAAGGKTFAQGDADGDGDVDDTDLGLAISGFTGPLAPASVPEPASAVLVALGVLVARRRLPR